MFNCKTNLIPIFHSRVCCRSRGSVVMQSLSFVNVPVVELVLPLVACQPSYGSMALSGTWVQDEPQNHGLLPQPMIPAFIYNSSMQNVCSALGNWRLCKPGKG